jgi:hypothetical protein
VLEDGSIHAALLKRCQKNNSQPCLPDSRMMLGFREKLKGAADLDTAVALANEAGFDVSKADWLKEGLDNYLLGNVCERRDMSLSPNCE